MPHGHYNTCSNLAFYGLMTDGGMAQQCVVRADTVHKLPDSVPVETAALVEPMSVSYHAAKMGEVPPGGSALVFGAGPIGIGTWFTLRGLGVDDVTVVEPGAARRNALAALGADVVDPAQTPVMELVMERTEGRGVDAVFDAAGVPAVVNQALSCVARRSPLVIVAMQGFDVPTHHLLLLMGERRILGSMAYTSEDYRAVIGLMAAGHYDTTGWVDTIPLTRVVDEGFEALHEGRKMKVLVDPTR